MNFGNPNILWLLLVIPPAMIGFLWWSWKKRQQLVTQFIQARLLPGLLMGFSPLRQKIGFVCVVLAAICLIVALARPRWDYDYEVVSQRGLDIVVAIDTSRSMLAEDIAPNRLARAKLAALELMQRSKSDRLGLVAFSGTAFLQCPLTIDDGAFRQSVESLDTTTLPQGGTAIAEAIDVALSAFKEGDNHRVMVLFTDGEDHDSGALEAAKRASEAGMRIFTIGIGSSEGTTIQLKDNKGRTDYVRDPDGNVVKSHLDERLLQEIAGETKGVYFPLRGATVIDALYRDWLAPLPKSESTEKLVKQYRERYHWPLGLGLLLLIVEVLLPERKREPRQKSATAKTGGSTSAPRQVAAAALVMMLPLVVQGSASSALREYKDGHFDQSLKEYEQLLQKKKDDPKLHFNAGTAAYRSKQYETAIKEFNESMTALDLKLLQQAYYNRGNSLYYLGEANQDPEKKQKTWEDALKDFESTMKLNKQDGDAQYNYEFVKKKIEELKQQQQQKQNQQKPPDPSEDAKKAKAEADAAVKRREYPKALEIMETQLKKDPTTAAYSDYIQRLKEITGVQEHINH